MNLNARIHALINSTDRRNFALGVANGAFTQLGMNLTHPSLVLSVFVRVLGGSNALVGLLPAIRFGGWFLPQFLAASWIQPQRRKVPIAVGMEVVRLAIYALLGISAYTLGLSNPGLLLLLFFALFGLSRLTTGTGALARTDAIGKIVSPRRRAAFFAGRSFWGGLFVFGAGFLVRYVLDETHGLRFPVNFTLLFGLSVCSFLIALLLFSRTREQPGPPDRPRHSLRAQLARAPDLLRQDRAFRRYVLVRALLNTTRLAAPFYPIFALDVLGAPASMVGTYLSAMTLARILSNLLWQRLGRARGNRFLVKTAALLTALEPLLAAGLPWIMRLTGITVERNGLLPAYLFTVVFLMAGSTQSGRSIGFMALLLDIAPDAERASYIGLVNTVLGFVSVLPILSGAFIDRLGFEPIFFIAAGLLLLGYLVTLKWETGHKKPAL
ncbi:MAG: MFS transporter [Anaerolineae bacterium]|nr:MAG: MFS transporter [Anaerolineae bacterium]